MAYPVFFRREFHVLTVQSVQVGMVILDGHIVFPFKTNVGEVHKRITGDDLPFAVASENGGSQRRGVQIVLRGKLIDPFFQ